jgi:hypothetical protein
MCVCCLLPTASISSTSINIILYFSLSDEISNALDFSPFVAPVLRNTLPTAELVPCMCGVFLSGQFVKGRQDQPKGNAALLHEHTEPLPCNPYGNKQCTNKCLDLVSIFLSVSLSLSLTHKHTHNRHTTASSCKILLSLVSKFTNFFFYPCGVHPVALCIHIPFKYTCDRKWEFISVTFLSLFTTCFGPYGPSSSKIQLHHLHILRKPSILQRIRCFTICLVLSTLLYIQWRNKLLFENE